jgi:catechol 2,3-dioxygenase-like lactoylglutathione lyase family enzyme
MTRSMFSHVFLGANDLDRAQAFYDAVLGALGVRPGKRDGNRVLYMTASGLFAITKPIDGEPATHANGGTLGFTANSAAEADAWHAAGLAAGGTTCEDPPGVRESGFGKLYLAYLRDPDGNKLCVRYIM